MAVPPPGNTPWVQAGGVPSPIFLAYILSLAQIGTSFTASLGADVALNNTGIYFDGPSVAQGTIGTWLVSATVTLIDTGASSTFRAKLWDGNTVIASAAQTVSAAGLATTISLSGIITSPTGNLRISVRNTSTTTGKILFNQSLNSMDSTISAIRIA